MTGSMRGNKVVRVILLLDLAVLCEGVGTESQDWLLLNTRIVGIDGQLAARLRNSFRGKHAAFEQSRVRQSADGGDTAVDEAGPEEALCLVFDAHCAAACCFVCFELRSRDWAEAERFLQEGAADLDVLRFPCLVDCYEVRGARRVSNGVVKRIVEACEKNGTLLASEALIREITLLTLEDKLLVGETLGQEVRVALDLGIIVNCGEGKELVKAITRIGAIVEEFENVEARDDRLDEEAGDGG